MQIYKITNTISGKFYIGLDTKSRKEYLGSGIYIKRAIDKYGIENFKKEILEECETKEELCEREKFWIKKLNSKVPNGYNIADGGHGNNGKIFKGKNNPMYKKSLLSVWIKKYGLKKALEKERERNKKHGKHQKNKEECKYCHKIMNVGNLNEYHNDNCKLAPNPKIRKQREKIKCKYCERLISINLFDRWHNENCKLKFGVKKCHKI
ncbi:MAG: hypothetical protein JETCAE03_33140 [Ignavibacteriaceae bacterium]|jgi:group I intron endonuclease|nr:MAG: hypothetical protein JETCAE03_33140 [Ignavibacteriaceae bacterium]